LELIFLLVTLSVTPLRKVTDQLLLIRFRRMFGLFSFFYVTLHFLTYIWLDKFFDIHEMLVDIAKRKFITVGFAGIMLLIPLAITSTSGWIRRLGGRRWNRLHQQIYLGAIAGVIHYYWLVKSGCPQAAAVRGCTVTAAGISPGDSGIQKFKVNSDARLPRPRVQVSSVMSAIYATGVFPDHFSDQRRNAGWHQIAG
jgi:methionine sulfoxide reductase heme-binding subunit